MNEICAITFAVNTSKSGAQETARFLAGIAQCEGVETKIEEAYPLHLDALHNQDLCIAVGGDGTLLGVMEAALQAGTPVLGVNLGKLGFLATFSKTEAAEDLAQLIAGNYSIAERSIICCTNKNGSSIYGLNDVVVKETQGSGLIRLGVFANDNAVSEYHCDGLIFSTPTGSTAYNLSAGGPILAPQLSALAMTPICPHTFGNRSVIFDDSTSILIESISTGETEPRITIDGCPQFVKEDNFPLKIRIAEKKFRLMQRPDHAHFAIVRDKLNWGEAAIRD